MENHYHENITLEIIADKANLSKSYFTKLFKDNAGMTFNNYLTLFRLQKARELLIASEENIADIVYQCGFNSVKTFNRVFNKHMGYSPSQYRKVIFEKNKIIYGK